jgi:hypothetical protein
MPRMDASLAGQELIVYAARQGAPIIAGQIKRWRERGLWQPNTRRALGREKGSRRAPGQCI